MAYFYVCDRCGQRFSTLSGNHTPEELGLNRLSGDELEQLTSIDDEGNMVIRSLCDDCVEYLDLEDIAGDPKNIIH